MAALKFIYATEAQILALLPSESNWNDRAFYYPEDKDYFYQALNGVMKKYGSGEGSSVGVKLNAQTFGGVKTTIESADVLDIPQFYAYNTTRLNVAGVVEVAGEVNII